MQEMNPWEKQLQSWTPRRPSAKIGRRLFAGVAPAPVFLRRPEVWNWLTPVAACVLTLLVAVQSSNRHLPHSSASDNVASFATLMLNGVTSNLPRPFVLSKLDENVEWNIWSHPFPANTLHWSAVPTNH